MFTRGYISGGPLRNAVPVKRHILIPGERTRALQKYPPASSVSGHHSQMRTMVIRYIYLQNWAIFGVNVGKYIPAPWFASGYIFHH